MTSSQETIAQSQFGPQAQAYIASAAHAQGADLQRIAAIAAEHMGASSLIESSSATILASAWCFT